MKNYDKLIGEILGDHFDTTRTTHEVQPKPNKEAIAAIQEQTENGALAALKFDQEFYFSENIYIAKARDATSADAVIYLANTNQN